MNVEINEMRKLQLQKAAQDFAATLPEGTVYTIACGLSSMKGFGIFTNASPRDLRVIAEEYLRIAEMEEKGAQAKTAPKLVTP